nr:MAG TPA: hypothetical protein [Caudoviricetes sp.]
MSIPFFTSFLWLYHTIDTRRCQGIFCIFLEKMGIFCN